MTPDLRTALTQFQEAYLKLLTLIESYPHDKREQPDACGMWSPKEVLAHLAGWLVEADARYRLYEKDSAPAPKHYDDIDAFNEESVRARSGLTWQEQVNELRANYAVIVHHAEHVAARGGTPFVGYTSWLVSLANDCAEHTDQLRAFGEATPA